MLPRRGVSLKKPCKNAIFIEVNCCLLFDPFSVFCFPLGTNIKKTEYLCYDQFGNWELGSTGGE